MRPMPHTHLGSTLRAAAWGAMARVANRTWRNAVTRNELAELDDHMLADIGVTRGAVAGRDGSFSLGRRVAPAPARRGPRAVVRQRASAMWQRHRSRQRIRQLDADHVEGHRRQLHRSRGRGEQAVLARLIARARSLAPGSLAPGSLASALKLFLRDGGTRNGRVTPEGRPGRADLAGSRRAA